MALRRRLLGTASLAIVVAVSSALAGGPAFGDQHQAVAATNASAGSLCVGSKPGCFPTIQAAVDAAHDGDTIRILAGTFTGGVTIEKSVTLIGAGPNATTISGGGPVVTIGQSDAPSEPTVAIKDVTITGGVNTSNPLPFFAAGGGIAVPAPADGGNRATVTISDSLITGNRAAPASTSPSPSGVVCGGGNFCPYAQGEGGGIYNAGVMTLNNVIVSNNEAGSSVASDSDAGGISNQPDATLTIRGGIVSGNVARAPAPNGRFAEGAGIFARRGSTLTMDGSSVVNNRAELLVAQDVQGDTLAQSGGIRLGLNVSATIRGTTISGNSVSATNMLGDAVAFSGGLHFDGQSLILRDSIVSDNSVTVTVPAGSQATADGDSGAGEMNETKTISNTRFTGNSVTATAPTGTAIAVGGAIITAAPDMTISDSIVSGNSVTATTTTGSVIAQGSGIWNISVLTLRNTTVSNNTGTALGPHGVDQGGGIWNAPIPDGPPTVQLTLADSFVTHNTLTASPGIAVQGGGLFTTFPVTLKNSLIAQNLPDDCYGC